MSIDAGGVTVRGIEIRMMDELKSFIRNNDIEIAILTIPKTKAVAVANMLVENGIRAIWNFAHTDLNLPEHIVVENVHLSESLMRLYLQCTTAMRRSIRRKNKSKKDVREL